MDDFSEQPFFEHGTLIIDDRDLALCLRQFPLEGLTPEQNRLALLALQKGYKWATKHGDRIEN